MRSSTRIRTLLLICVLVGTATAAPAQVRGVRRARIAASQGSTTAAAPRAAAPLVHVALMHGGLERHYHVHLPGNAPPSAPVPVVFVLHGGSGTGAPRLARLTGFNEVADREGFIVVYPAGVDGQWNDGRGRTFRRVAGNSDVDDVGFLSAAIDDLAARYAVDLDRVYVTGMSNGGMMTLRLGVEVAPRLAAIAPVIANLPANVADTLAAGPLPVLLINGTDDPLVPWEGGQVHVLTREFGEVLSTDATVRYWLARNGLSGPPQTRTLPDRDPNDGCRVEVSTWTAPGVPEVTLYAVRGGGHNPPGGHTLDVPALVGRKCMDINGTEEIWAFFQRHRRAAPTP